MNRDPRSPDPTTHSIEREVAVTDTVSDTITEPSAPSTPWPELGVVGRVVDHQISRLQRAALANRASGVAALARLRRGVGKPPGTVPDILEYTLATEFVTPQDGDDPTAREIAAHIVMTLYALHQQSQDRPMHRRGWGLGRAVRRLHGPDPDLTGPVRRRFDALGTADDLTELVHHARGMVQLLRSKGIPLDYAVLGDQLTRWQSCGEPAKIRLIWGRDFYRTTSSPDQSTPERADSERAESASPEGN
jgi:CRISPR system Cascade subunit CasB